MSEDKRTLLINRDQLLGRRRIAPRVVESSDVTRHRGVLLGVLGGILGAGGAIAFTEMAGVDTTTPRPLSRPHREAKLECASCHRPDVTKAVEACSSCHGEQLPAREPHVALAKSGALTCTTCHNIHIHDAGVTLKPDGSRIRYRDDQDVDLDKSLAVQTADKTTSVPIVPASACGGCHDPKDKRDPVAGCLIDGQSGGSRPTVCFDEHRSVLAGVTSGRSAAWEAARDAAVQQPEIEAGEGKKSVPAMLWVGSGLFLGFAAFGARRGISYLANRKVKKELTKEAVLPAVRQKLPQINTNTCIGCHACVDACPYDVLEVHNYVSVVVRPDDCCGLTLCEQKCPNGSLIVTDGEILGDRPRMSDDLESLDTPGVFLAGDLTGLPLIRNAINQGAHVVQTIQRSLQGTPPMQNVHDLVIVGAGPAGISAALQAKKLGLNYMVLEQGSVAESIRSFPRGKLVFDQPLGLPLIGDLWLEKATKEELLAKWMRAVHREKLPLHEQHRVTGLQVGQGYHHIGFTGPNGEGGVATKRVLLAFGRRGSPRKLKVEIPTDAESFVHYSLADARSFAGQRVLVCGLGDVAMETAVALANQPGTQVSMSYRGDDFKRGKTKNIQLTRRMIESGRIKMHWGTEVESVVQSRTTLKSPAGSIPIDNDALFVMIGNIAPWKFLEAMGVRRVGSEQGHAA